VRAVATASQHGAAARGCLATAPVRCETLRPGPDRPRLEGEWLDLLRSEPIPLLLPAQNDVQLNRVGLLQLSGIPTRACDGIPFLTRPGSAFRGSSPPLPFASSKGCLPPQLRGTWSFLTEDSPSLVSPRHPN